MRCTKVVAFLSALDTAPAKLRLFYSRFMDDILILAPTHGA
jgi:hypothetical protein